MVQTHGPLDGVKVVACLPELGEHNVDILTHLGYSKAQIQAFKDQKIV